MPRMHNTALKKSHSKKLTSFCFVAESRTNSHRKKKRKRKGPRVLGGGKKKNTRQCSRRLISAAEKCAAVKDVVPFLLSLFKDVVNVHYQCVPSNVIIQIKKKNRIA